jgi:2'-5' RNA ligase superfamily
MPFNGAPRQLSLNFGPQPKRPPSAPEFPQRNDLFFAIYLDAVAAARGARLARALCGQSQSAGRPRPTETLHVTLVPVGVASLLPAQAFSVLRQAAALIDQAAFNVAFDRVASFRGGSALVLLCGDGVSALTTLRKSLHAAMTSVGFRAPSRFKPSSEPGCSRDQKQSCPDGDGPGSSRDALTGRRQTFDGDGCRHDSHRAKVHDADDQKDRH